MPALLSLLGLVAIAVPDNSAMDVLTPRFDVEVMTVLSKAGCNVGVCHGNLNGKNGFRLSLRGDDPHFDWESLAREQWSRRANVQEPARSLLLLKATAEVPHEGGRRFGRDSREYRILHAWIRRGMPREAPNAFVSQLTLVDTPAVIAAPNDSVQLRVHAHFTDGRRRDVTSWAVYEPNNLNVQVSADGLVQRRRFGDTAVLVRFLGRQTVARLTFIPERPEFQPAESATEHPLDRAVFAHLHARRVNLAPRCDDSTFIRRLYLDILGQLPTSDETRKFLADARPDKRDRLIDQVLARPEFADHWALKWSDLLRNEEKTLDRKGVNGLHGWLRQQFASDRPLDAIVGDIVRAQGSTYQNPPANFYRALRDPMSRAEAVAQVFLGVRLQCAKCHNHPFDQMTQDDYHRLTAYFARVQYRILENNRRDRFDLHEFDGEQVVWQDRVSEWPHPRTGRPTEPRPPGSTPTPAPSADRLADLADWLTAPNNEAFARAQANRVWYQVMGRGLVDPMDDFRASNPPTIPGALDALVAHFRANRFRVKPLLRLILTSHTYQTSSTATPPEEGEEEPWVRTQPQPLPAEVILDACAQVLGTTVDLSGQPAGMRAGQLAGVQPSRSRGLTDAHRFLMVFGKPQRLLTCECERVGEPTLNQAFQLMSGPALHQMLTKPDNRLGHWLAAKTEAKAIVHEAFLLALARPPTSAELTSLAAALDAAPDRRQALEDLMAGLLGSKAFILRN
jgi:hypothetical protein